MDSLEEFMKSYNAAQDTPTRKDENQRREKQKKRAIASCEEYIARLRQKRRSNEK